MKLDLLIRIFLLWKFHRTSIRVHKDRQSLREKKYGYIAADRRNIKGK